MEEIKKALAFIDCDGVLTDGSMYYTISGDSMRRFNTKDSAGILLLKRMGFTPFLISAEETEITHKRMSKLGIQGETGILDKLAFAKSKAKENDIELAHCIHIGDDLGDIELLKEVGTSYCPSDAAPYVQEIVSHILPVRGGEGVVRSAALHLAESKSFSIDQLISPHSTNTHQPS